MVARVPVVLAGTGAGMSRRHTHLCAFPGCKASVACSGEAVIDTDEDGVRGGYLTCEEHGPVTALCEDHEDETPCGWCGDYGHDEGWCPGLGGWASAGCGERE